MNDNRSQSSILKILPKVACLLFFMAIPLLIPEYTQSMMIKVVIFAAFALSLNLIWSADMISLGHATYFGIACYVTAILSTQYGIANIWIILGAALLVTGIVALVFGVIVLRVSGVYFLMVTLALGQLVFFSTLAFRGITNGMNGLFGIPWPDLGFMEMEWDKVSFYYFTLVVSAISVFILYRINVSPFGYALRGIAEDETKMKTLGINTWLIKYIAYIISALLAAVPGVLFSFFFGIASPMQLSVETSTLAVLMLIIGSSTVFWGPVTGAFIVIILEYFASIYLPARWPLLLGVVFVCSVMFVRDGISIYIINLWKKWVLNEDPPVCSV